MEELQAARAEDPLARLVFLVHLPELPSQFSTVPAVTTCYDARFNYYGIIRGPRRIACPENAVPITPPRTGATARGRDPLRRQTSSSSGC